MMQDQNTTNNRRKKRQDIAFNRRTLLLIAVCGILSFIVLIGRLYYLQVIKYDYYAEQAAGQQVRSTAQAVVRGTITDRNGNVLAVSERTKNVILNPFRQKEYEDNAEKEAKEAAENGEEYSYITEADIAAELSAVLGVDYDSVLSRFSNKESWYEVIKKQVDLDTAAQIQSFIDENRLEGVYLEDSSERSYPYNDLACHVLGFVGGEETGLEGVEYTYNSYLTGTSSRTIRLVNGWGNEMLSSAVDSSYTVGDGDNIRLTIDATIEEIVESNLEQAIQVNDVLNGAACIAMNPNTGEILAMASYGKYDCNNYQLLDEETTAELNKIEDKEEREQAIADAMYKQLRNKALSDTYEPGSVFKTITLSMALEENLVSDADSFYCGGYTYVTGREDPIWCSNNDGHGVQTLTEATENSCNCAYIEIGDRVGAETFYEYVDAFGLFDDTGIDLSGEGASLWWDTDVFTNPENKSQLAAASFGQTFTVTPIQMITAFSAACNGGYLMQPYVVKSVEDCDGNTVLLNEPTVKRQVISNETSQKVNEILEKVVSEGSGQNAYVAGYRIAGKTGTSEKVTENLSSDEKDYIVSFCGFAPANDPQVVVLLLLDTPSHDSGRSIYGSVMAAPAVGSILSEVLDYLGYEPEYAESELAEDDVTVPELDGWTKADATAALNYEGLGYEIIGSGETVTAQYPAGWTSVASGSKVVLYFGTEPSTDKVTVPNLYGLSYLEARDRLERAGLYLSCRSGSISGEMTVGTQYQEAGAEVPYGTIVEVALINASIQDD